MSLFFEKFFKMKVLILKTFEGKLKVGSVKIFFFFDYFFHSKVCVLYRELEGPYKTI